MSDFGASISLSRDHSSSSSDRAPLSPAPLSSGGARLTTTTTNTVVEEDSRPRYPNNRQLMLSTPISRKPRGRPPGSKNKPKPPIIITRDSELAVKSALVDVPAGCCIMDSIMKFACANGVGVSVQTVSGSVAAVTLRQPASHAPPVTLAGPFNILSLHGTFLGGCAAAVANANPGLVYSRPFTIVFSGGAQPQVAGGLVSGSLVAASQVYVTLSTFAAPVVYSMGSDDPDQDRKDGGGGSANGGGGAGGNEGFGGGNSNGGGNGGGGVSTGMSMGMYGGGGGAPINPPKMSRTQDVLQWAASASGSHPPPAAY